MNLKLYKIFIIVFLFFSTEFAYSNLCQNLFDQSKESYWLGSYDLNLTTDQDGVKYLLDLYSDRITLEIVKINDKKSQDAAKNHDNNSSDKKVALSKIDFSEVDFSKEILEISSNYSEVKLNKSFSLVSYNYNALSAIFKKLRQLLDPFIAEQVSAQFIMPKNLMNLYIKINNYDRLVQNKVIELYSKAKSYLSSEDFSTLTVVSNFLSDNEVMVLTRLNEKQEKVVAMTARISFLHYFRERNPLLKELLLTRTRLYPTVITRQLLPFMYRHVDLQELRIDQFNQFLDQFYQANLLFKKLVEINRFARFESINQNIKKRFMFELFSKIKKSGADRIIITADQEKSAQFITEYGFEFLRDSFNTNIVVNTTVKNQTEYLLFLDVKTQQFDELLEKLFEESRDEK